MVSSNEGAEEYAATGPHIKAVNARGFVLHELKIVEEQLNNLNREIPEIEKFKKISSEYESLLKKYKQRNISILANLNKNSISPSADLVERDQEEFRSNVLKMDNAFSTYSTLICEEEMGETKDSQLEEVLKRLGNLGNKSPNVTQPSFTPKNNSGDFTAFREFLFDF